MRKKDKASFKLLIIDFMSSEKIKEAKRLELLQDLTNGWEIINTVSINRSISVVGNYYREYPVKGIVQYILKKK